MSNQPSPDEFETDPTGNPPRVIDQYPPLGASPRPTPDLEAQLCRINAALGSYVKIIKGMADSLQLDKRALKLVLDDIETIRKENQAILDTLRRT